MYRNKHSIKLQVGNVVLSQLLIYNIDVDYIVTKLQERKCISTGTSLKFCWFPGE